MQEFSEFAKQRGVSELDLAFSWLAAQPGVGSVIAGATKPEQVRANAQAASVLLSAADLSALDLIFPKTPKVALF